MASEATKEKALAALDGMREIVRAEMLAAGIYVHGGVSNPGRLHNVCGGRKHCAIGSLWAGAGIKPIFTHGELQYPGILDRPSPDGRDNFLRTRHGLRLAYQSLNGAASKFIDANRDRVRVAPFSAPIEGLFEGSWDDGDLTRQDMLKIISAAKRKVKAA